MNQILGKGVQTRNGVAHAVFCRALNPNRQAEKPNEYRQFKRDVEQETAYFVVERISRGALESISMADHRGRLYGFSDAVP